MWAETDEKEKHEHDLFTLIINKHDKYKTEKRLVWESDNL